MKMKVRVVTLARKSIWYICLHLLLRRETRLGGEKLWCFLRSSWTMIRANFFQALKTHTKKNVIPLTHNFFECRSAGDGLWIHSMHLEKNILSGHAATTPYRQQCLRVKVLLLCLAAVVRPGSKGLVFSAAERGFVVQKRIKHISPHHHKRET